MNVHDLPDPEKFATEEYQTYIALQIGKKVPVFEAICFILSGDTEYETMQGDVHEQVHTAFSDYILRHLSYVGMMVTSRRAYIIEIVESDDARINSENILADSYKVGDKLAYLFLKDFMHPTGARHSILCGHLLPGRIDRNYRPRNYQNLYDIYINLINIASCCIVHLYKIIRCKTCRMQKSHSYSQASQLVCRRRLS